MKWNRATPQDIQRLKPGFGELKEVWMANTTIFRRPGAVENIKQDLEIQYQARAEDKEKYER